MNDKALDELWMKEALKCAQKAYDQGEVPVGAIVVHDGEIIGQGWNQPISKCDPTAHAEVMALREAAKNTKNYRLIDTTLYVTIEPCTMCWGAMVHSRVKRLVYGASEPKSGVIQSNLYLNKQGVYNCAIEVVENVLKEECSQIIQAFFKERREQKKRLN